MVIIDVISTKASALNYLNLIHTHIVRIILSTSHYYCTRMLRFYLGIEYHSKKLILK